MIDGEDQERDQLGVALEVPGGEGVEHADGQAADDRAGDAAEPAEDRRREPLDAERAAQRRVDVQQRPDQAAGQRGQPGPDRERDRVAAPDVDADRGGRLVVHRDRLHRGAPLGALQEQHQQRRVAIAAMRQDHQVVGPDRGCRTGPSGAAGTGEGTARPVAPQIRMTSASSTMPKPIVPISIRSKSLFSSGRSTRSMTRPIVAGHRDRDHHGDRERQPGGQVEGGREVRADRHDVAVREVDQPHGAVDEREAQGDQGVDGAEAEPADDRLEEDLHRCPPRRLVAAGPDPGRR